MVVHAGRYSALDALRGTAAIAVVLFHCGIYLHDPAVMGHGALAVDVFFVMSGFVIERAYGERLRIGWSVRAFAAARFKRLYPLYALGTLLGAVCFAIMLGSNADSFAYLTLCILVLCAAVLVPIPRSDDKAVFPLNGPSWSLMAEAVVNVLYVLILRRLSIFALSLVALISACTLCGAYFSGYSLLLGGQTATLWLDLTRAAFGFSVGLLLAVNEDRIRVVPLASIRLPLLLIISVCIYAIPADAVPPWADLLGIILVSPMIVAAAILSRPRKAADGWCGALGRISYPLYIVHMPVLYTFSSYAPAGSEPSSLRTTMILGSSVISLGLAWCLSLWSEPASTRARRAMLLAAPFR